MSDEHKVMCYWCHKEFRPVISQIKLVCNDCYDEELDKAQAIGYEKGIIKGRELQKQEDISKFLKSWDYMMKRIEFHTENPDSELMDEVSEKYKKWELMLNK